ncbi:MAG: PASTA domain-containing protein [Alistipes sp.]
MEKLIGYWKKLKTKPLAYNFVLIVASLLALGIISHVLMQFGTRHGSRCTVPDFAGITLQQAEELADDNDLTLVINDSLFVPAYEGGMILDQLPEKGVEVKPGRTVYITINSFKPKIVAVPYVAGRSLRQAKNMLELAGLEIEKLIYRTDMATNYVLEEYCDGRQVTGRSKMQIEMGSGVTLYVGAESDRWTTVTPRLIGFHLKEAKSRLWELGLNVGNITFDKGINLLNQKDARVYVQAPGQERNVQVGTAVDLVLTLDIHKADKLRKEAEQAAAGLVQKRLEEAQLLADSLATLPLDESATKTETSTENTTTDTGFLE